MAEKNNFDSAPAAAGPGTAVRRRQTYITSSESLGCISLDDLRGI